VTVDSSIHRAYVHAIRRARRFVYIENQYFLGGSNMWPGAVRNVADNLVPIEIALKIADKIHRGERFAAYILMPMFPEGVVARRPGFLYFQSTVQQRALGTPSLRCMRLGNSVPKSVHPD
jgi:phospholipase D1/2